MSLTTLLIALGAVALLGLSHSAIPQVSGQETALKSGGVSPCFIEGAVELAEIRIAIRVQVVEVAKAERRVLSASTDGRDDILRATLAKTRLEQLKRQLKR
ncbi:MAG: hypothetical protein R3B90_01915 [Planctomycetaceae bacterium]